MLGAKPLSHSRMRYCSSAQVVDVFALSALPQQSVKTDGREDQTQKTDRQTER
jgi:hypothetical protein